MKKIIALSLIAISSHSYANEPLCAQDAREDALQLMRFHSGGDDRAGIGDHIKSVTRAVNFTAAEGQNSTFDTLELDGFVYLSSYRIRLTYIPSESKFGCPLVGQEIVSTDTVF